MKKDIIEQVHTLTVLQHNILLNRLYWTRKKEKDMFIMMNENMSTKEVERKAHYLYRSFKHVAELSAIAEKVWSHPVHHAPVLQQVVLRGIMVRMEVVICW